MNNKGLIGGAIILIIFAVFVFGIIVGFGLSNEQTPEVIFENQDQPMLLIEHIEWFENAEDSSERIFDYFVYNFGNTESKNVNVRCEITDIHGILLQKQIFNIGNIASNSYEFQESIMKFNGVKSETNKGICYLESADGEYINLYDRIDGDK